ncbi:MAG: S4 domain-containing protein [Acidobacteriota bacterium]
MNILLSVPTICPSVPTKVLVLAELAASNSEARRLMKQGGVKVDGEAAGDPKTTVAADAEKSLLIQVGKRRIAKVTIAKAESS